MGNRKSSGLAGYCYHAHHGTQYSKSESTPCLRVGTGWQSSSRRVAKDIAIAVHAGGPDPAANPTLRRVLQNARAVNKPKDKTDAAIRRASGKVKRPIIRKSSTKVMHPTGLPCWWKQPPTTPRARLPAVRNIFSKGAGNLGATGSVSFLFKKIGRVSPGPRAAVKDQDELELDLIDHGLEEMGDSTGDKGEPQLVIRGAFNDLANYRKRSRSGESLPCRPSTSTFARCPSSCPRPKRPKS